MAHNLQEMMRDKTSSEKVGPNYNSDNASDVALVIKQIKLHIQEMERFQIEFERKVIEENRAYKLKITNSLEVLRKLIDS